MKICIIVEGCYPYIVGGVSSWVHMLITQMPQHEFVIQTISVNPEDRGKFEYTLPSNVTSISEIFLNDKDYVTKKNKEISLSKKEKDAFESFVFADNINWSEFFDVFLNNEVPINSFAMGKDFFDILERYCLVRFNRVVMTNFLWTYRSMMMPLITMLKHKPPQADAYHAVSTGYAGVMAAMAKHIYKKPVVLTEHGIYTRERVEDIIRSDWTMGIYKDVWIEHFYKLSDCVYSYADKVISLFNAARDLQIEIGCHIDKTLMIPNGININRFNDAPLKEENDTSINLGIIARIVPIKDIKTLINSFSFAKEQVKDLKLYIMGPCDEDIPYYEECLELIEMLKVKDIIFTGRVDVKEYIGKIDISILTSISEGQPLSMLEFMCAGIPCISTNVGGCEELILGKNPDDEPAGIITPVLNVAKISDAIITLAKDPALRKKMGMSGKERVREYYDEKSFIESYEKLYEEISAFNFVQWDKDAHKIERKSNLKEQLD